MNVQSPGVFDAVVSFGGEPQGAREAARERARKPAAAGDGGRHDERCGPQGGSRRALSARSRSRIARRVGRSKRSRSRAASSSSRRTTRRSRRCVAELTEVKTPAPTLTPPPAAARHEERKPSAAEATKTGVRGVPEQRPALAMPVPAPELDDLDTKPPGATGSRPSACCRNGSRTPGYARCRDRSPTKGPEERAAGDPDPGEERRLAAPASATSARSRHLHRAVHRFPTTSPIRISPAERRGDRPSTRRRRCLNRCRITSLIRRRRKIGSRATTSRASGWDSTRRSRPDRATSRTRSETATAAVGSRRLRAGSRA